MGRKIVPYIRISGTFSTKRRGVLDVGIHLVFAPDAGRTVESAVRCATFVGETKKNSKRTVLLEFERLRFFYAVTCWAVSWVRLDAVMGNRSVKTVPLFSSLSKLI